MEQYNIVPLGFSDLNQNESLLISIFRKWYQERKHTNKVENSIKELLKKDKIYTALEEVFSFFRRFVYRRLILINDNEILSSTEEFLLEILGSSEENDNLPSQRCRVQLQNVMTLPRPIECIHRSGYDLVQYKVAQSYRKFMVSPL